MGLPELTNYNVYCDESCHLQHDPYKVMVLGAVSCPAASVPGIHQELRQLKTRHGLNQGFEVKWNKVSPAGSELYLDYLNYFFRSRDLRFRALVVPDKTTLDHTRFKQTHDDWYYKMYFTMLKAILSDGCRFRIYLDIKDTRSSEKLAKLHEVLCSSMRDFSRSLVCRVQSVRSHEVSLLQLADLLIGAVAYANRGLSTSQAKVALVEHIQEQSGLLLTRTTPLHGAKINILRWHPGEAPA